jgi:hypothetical protein
VIQVAARRPRKHASAVDEKLVAIISARMYHESRGIRLDRKSFSEMKDAEFAARRVRAGNPNSFPSATEQLRVLLTGNL